MKRRICLHWTGGNTSPNSFDLKHYTFLVDEACRLLSGILNGKVLTIEDNDNCYDDRYAMHCGGGNTRTIGFAICGYLGFNHPKQKGNQIPGKQQFEAFFKHIAQVAKGQDIPITEDYIYTHAEFGLKNPKTSSRGKIDFYYIPDYWGIGEIVGIKKCGNFIRKKIKWYLNEAEKPERKKQMNILATVSSVINLLPKVMPALKELKEIICDSSKRDEANVALDNLSTLKKVVKGSTIAILTFRDVALETSTEKDNKIYQKMKEGLIQVRDNLNQVIEKL